MEIEKKSSEKVEELNTEKNNQEKIDSMLMLKLNNFIKFKPFLTRYSRQIKLPEEISGISWARQHSNKLILFGVKNEHPMIQKKSKIIKTKFFLKGNRSEDDYRKLVSGKKKSK